MALTRARCVAGPLPLRQRASDRRRHPAATRTDALAMRARTLRDHPPHGLWDVKLRPGGQLDVEYVVQVLLLLTAAARPASTTRVAIARLLRAGALAADDAATLTAADRLWRTVQGMLRITVGPRAPDRLPTAALEALVLAAGLGCDAAGFRARLDAMAVQVRAVYDQRLGASG